MSQGARMSVDTSTDNLDVAIGRLREGLQELALRGLAGAGFFDRATFHGGTCLRILHGLDRFSEDLDFMLRETDYGFGFEPYLDKVVADASEVGLEIAYTVRPPRGEKMVYSAKLKTNLRDALGAAGFRPEVVRSAHSQELLTVKLDVDLDPPAYSREILFTKTEPLEYTVRTEPLPVLFAGKTSAVLCRHWGNRVKGRDMYDFRWYIEHGIPIDLECLTSQMDKKCMPTDSIDRNGLVRMLEDRFDALDWASAEEDVKNFIRPEQLGDWGPEPFKALARRIEVQKG